jgi:NADPH:quinone reductase-like Zn-dependent oxidoreductase
MVAVRKSTIIDAAVDDVWRFLRDFNAHERWHPAVAASLIEDGRDPDEVACVRAFRLQDGAGLREQLLSLSDRDRTFSYCILDAPIPLIGYVATVRLKPVTDGGRTFWEWSSSFAAPAERADELARLVGEDIYEAGFDAVKQHFGQTVGRRSRPPSPSRPSVTAAAVQRSAEASAPAAGGAIEAHAIVIRRHGGPEVLSWETVSVPPPGPGELRLRHTAIGVNYIDIYCRTGYFAMIEPPGVLGMEGAGVVLDVGPGVNGILPGDRVAYACPPVGAYAECRTMPAELVVVLPADIPDETAAAGLLKGMSAEFLLHRVHQVKEGDVALVHAAAGGVGTLLCQWARRLGATVIGTVSTAEKARIARANGCAYPIVRPSEDFVAKVMEITGNRGCDVVYDAVGRDTISRSIDCLAVLGHLVSYGQASGDIGAIDVAGLAAKSATISRPNFGHYTDTPAKVRAITDRLFDAIRRGDIRVEIGRRLALRDAAEAHRALEARETTGSVILLP